jgi:emfourin
MHIDFTRTGGFAGLRLSTSVDTSELPPEQAQEVDHLISEAAFFDLPKELLPQNPRPDRFEYRLTVDAGDRSHSVVVSDAAAPESLRPLLNYLTTLAMVSRKK